MELAYISWIIFLAHSSSSNIPFIQPGGPIMQLSGLNMSGQASESKLCSSNCSSALVNGGTPPGCSPDALMQLVGPTESNDALGIAGVDGFTDP